MRERTEKEIKNIIYELHESDFIDYKIEANNLILRVAIDCTIEDRLNVESENGEKYYIYDIICHNYKDFKLFNETNADLLLAQILSFYISNDKYYFFIQSENFIYVKFEFDCKYIEWKPIKVVFAYDLHYTDSVAESFKFNKA